MLVNTKYKKLCKLLFTFQSVFSWIIQEVDPEVLPPVFHLECRTPTNCPNSNCPHIYELQNSYKVNVADLPEILYLREGVCISEAIIGNALKEIAYTCIYIYCYHKLLCLLSVCYYICNPHLFSHSRQLVCIA